MNTEISASQEPGVAMAGFLAECLDAAAEAAREAGQFIRSALGTLTKDDIGMKGVSDYVTDTDRRSETLIVTALAGRFPDHSFLTEETRRYPGRTEYLWIVDPLDGTTNFIHGFPVFSVSVALYHLNSPLVGVIYDPLRDELFSAVSGLGSLLNGRVIRVSSVTALGDSLVATGFPFRRKILIRPYLVLFENLFVKISDLRRAGSAALDLAYVAAGRCDGFFEVALSPWDIAAGALIVTEAGGMVTDFGGGGEFLNTGNIIAANGTIHNGILREAERAFKGIIER